MSFEDLSENDIVKYLRELEADPEMITTPAFTSNTALYPDNQIPFVDKHLAYLKAHKNLNSAHYFSNLRLMLKKT